jgi:hypothetical protein
MVVLSGGEDGDSAVGVNMMGEMGLVNIRILLVRVVRRHPQLRNYFGRSMGCLIQLVLCSPLIDLDGDLLKSELATVRMGGLVLGVTLLDIRL